MVLTVPREWSLLWVLEGDEPGHANNRGNSASTSSASFDRKFSTFTTSVTDDNIANGCNCTENTASPVPTQITEESIGQSGSSFAAVASETVLSIEGDRIVESSGELVAQSALLSRRNYYKVIWQISSDLSLLPWGTARDSTSDSKSELSMVVGEYVLHSILVDFAQKVSRKVDSALLEPLVSNYLAFVCVSPMSI